MITSYGPEHSIGLKASMNQFVNNTIEQLNKEQQTKQPAKKQRKAKREKK